MAAAKVATEADVESKVVERLLTDSAFLGIPPTSIRSKTYLAPTATDKRSGKSHGYIPDFSVWIDGLPILIVEAKAPDVQTAAGYREATLYALHLNRQFKSKLNPCSLVLATNGVTLLAGDWDAEPQLDLNVVDLEIGRPSCSGYGN